MSYLSTREQQKTNLIIFGILLGKFISLWILLAWTICMPSLLCINLVILLMEFSVEIQAWTQFFFHRSSTSCSISCTCWACFFEQHIYRYVTNYIQTSWKDNIFLSFLFCFLINYDHFILCKATSLIICR